MEGPHGFITQVDLDLYKVEVDDIKTHFFPAALSTAPSFTPAALSTITLPLGTRFRESKKLTKIDFLVIG